MSDENDSRINAIQLDFSVNADCKVLDIDNKVYKNQMRQEPINVAKKIR